MNLTFTQNDILTSAVDEIIGLEALKSKLSLNAPLRIKFGIDPTSPNIHLGRSVPLWKLRAFQELGHEIHLIVGDFTGEIGDTSDKDAERPMISAEVIAHNISFYLDQLWLILNPEKKELVHIHYNSQWLNELRLGKLGLLADAFSVNQFIKRELVAKRLEAGSRISLREMLYPLMQGYDSVYLQSDVELGGTDQRFNMLAGRILQEQAGQKPQSVIMNSLISGTDGRKMSSSWGNIISLRDSSSDKFGKLMATRDELLSEYLLVLPSSVRPFTAQDIQKRMDQGENPRDLKLELAQALVSLYHGEDEALSCREAFLNQFSAGNKPEEIPHFLISLSQASDSSLDIVSLLTITQLATSNSDARRLIEQGGVRLQDLVITDSKQVIDLSAQVLLQVGKRRFLTVSIDQTR